MSWYKNLGNPKHWKPEEEQQLFQMAKKKTPMPVVFKTYPKRTQRAVIEKIHKMGFSRANNTLQIK